MPAVPAMTTGGQLSTGEGFSATADMKPSSTQTFCSGTINFNWFVGKITEEENEGGEEGERRYEGQKEEDSFTTQINSSNLIRNSCETFQRLKNPQEQHQASHDVQAPKMFPAGSFR